MANFGSFEIAAVIIPPDRQRKELKPEKVKELSQSIAERGLINPITLEKDGRLLAGLNRLEACRLLGWTHIDATFFEELDDFEREAIELEENTKRSDLTWQETVDATERLHRLMSAKNPDWTAKQTAEKIGMDPSVVAKRLLVANEMKANPRIANAQQFSVARGLAQRADERRKAAEIEEIIGGPVTEAAAVDASIVNTEFETWAENYHGPRFNFLHCDFPYGVNLDKSAQMNAEAKGIYADSPDVYWNLLEVLAKHWGRIMQESCHVIFWFSMDYYEETRLFLQDRLGLVVNPKPLSWVKSDGAGILPDPSRGPRQVTETAFFAYGGDRKIISAVANGVALPTARTNKLHISEKPVAMLHHFFRMVVDENTVLLDPTCGSGSALRTAESLGARYVLGLERDPSHAEVATKALLQARSLKKASEKVST